MDHSTNAVEMSIKEKKRVAYRKWYAENRERINQKSRERYRNDPDFREKHKLYTKKWNANHPKAIAAANLRYYVNVLRREGYTVIPPEGVEG